LKGRGHGTFKGNIRSGHLRIAKNAKIAKDRRELKSHSYPMLDLDSLAISAILAILRWSDFPR